MSLLLNKDNEVLLNDYKEDEIKKSEIKDNNCEVNPKDCEVNLFQEVGNIGTKTKEDRDTDDYLLKFEKVLINIHSKFYEWYDELQNTKVIFYKFFIEILSNFKL